MSAADDDLHAPPAEPDGELSTGAAFLVNALQNARISELQAAFRALGWGPLRFVLVPADEAEEVSSG